MIRAAAYVCFIPSSFLFSCHCYHKVWMVTTTKVVWLLPHRLYGYYHMGCMVTTTWGVWLLLYGSHGSELEFLIRCPLAYFLLREYCFLSTDHCSLNTDCCKLFPEYCSLFTDHCKLILENCPLFF